jgi:hypothetical protein
VATYRPTRPVIPAGGLFGPPQNWDDLVAPWALTGRAPSASYERAWATLRKACAEVLLSPAEFMEHGFAELEERRATLGRAPWSEATRVLLTKVARYGGLPVGSPGPTPEPVVLSINPVPLWSADVGDLTGPKAAAARRNVLLCRLAWWWPADVGHWTVLKRDAVRLDGLDVVVEEATVAEGAGAALSAWLVDRADYGGETLLCTVRPSGHSAPGGPLSERALRSSFRTHAVARGIKGLGYDTYRRLAAATNGPAPGVSRGATGAGARSARAARSQLRLVRSSDAHRKRPSSDAPTEVPSAPTGPVAASGEPDAGAGSAGLSVQPTLGI